MMHGIPLFYLQIQYSNNIFRNKHNKLKTFIIKQALYEQINKMNSFSNNTVTFIYIYFQGK